MNPARWSYMASLLALVDAASFGRPRGAITVSSDLPAFVNCEHWKRRGLDLAKRRVRQERLR